MLAQGFLHAIHSKSRIFSLSVSSCCFWNWNNVELHPVPVTTLPIYGLTAVFSLTEMIKLLSASSNKFWTQSPCIISLRNIWIHLCNSLWGTLALGNSAPVKKLRHHLLRRWWWPLEAQSWQTAQVCDKETLKSQRPNTRFHIFPNLELGCHL